MYRIPFQGRATAAKPVVGTMPPGMVPLAAGPEKPDPGAAGGIPRRPSRLLSKVPGWAAATAVLFAACAAPMPAAERAGSEGAASAFGDTESAVPEASADPAGPPRIATQTASARPDPGTAVPARDLAARIAARYGAADFPKVRFIRFTLHEREGAETRVRHWTWHPGPDSVNYQGEDAKGVRLKADYGRKNRYSMASGTIAGIDGRFLRDRFWLFLPLQLAWDHSLDLKAGRDGRLSVRFPAQKGSPAEAVHEIETAPDGAIRATTLHRSETAAFRVEWSAPENVDGLPLSLERKGPDGFGIRFTDLEVVGLE